MARPLRIEFPGAVYHVTSRGNARQDIVVDDRDRTQFFSVLAHVVDRFGWLCHASCLMDNHDHLLLETPQPNLSRGMRQLNGRYTQAYNRRHERVGHLFQGRFTAILVEQEAHLLELCRYVVFNPVRANMVSHPRQWAWSSYRATGGETRGPEWLTTDWILGQFGVRVGPAQERYRTCVADGHGGPRPWEQLTGQISLGSEEFVAQRGKKKRGEEEKGTGYFSGDLFGRPCWRSVDSRPKVVAVTVCQSVVRRAVAGSHRCAGR